MHRIALPALLFAVGLLLIAAALARPRPEPLEYHGTYLGEDVAPGDFALESADRGTVALSDFRGRGVLLFFGYTTCPDVCPLTLARLRQVMELLGEQRSEVQVLFVSVDPELDSAATTRDYVRAFDPTFIGLTGDRDVVRETALSFGVYVGDPELAEMSEMDAMPGGADAEESGGHAAHGAAGHAAAAAPARLVAHSPHIFGIDRRGARRLVWDQSATAEQLAADLRTLLRL